MPNARLLPSVFEPIIDAKNPPVAVDSVLLAESLTGNVRVNCFSGNAYIERQEETLAQDGSKLMRMWIRPVAVVDIGYAAVRYIEGYLLQRLSNNPEELNKVLSDNPQLKAQLKAILTE